MKRHRIASCCSLLQDIIHPHLETKSSFDLEDKTTSASREIFKVCPRRIFKLGHD